MNPVPHLRTLLEVMSNLEGHILPDRLIHHTPHRVIDVPLCTLLQVKSTLEEHIFPARLSLHSVLRVNNVPHLHALLDVITVLEGHIFHSGVLLTLFTTYPSRTEVNFGIIHILPARLLLYLHLLVASWLSASSNSDPSRLPLIAHERATRFLLT